MMHFSDQQLQGFLDESLSSEIMAQLEIQLRSDAELHSRLVEICGKLEAGVHSLGDVWRRHRLSCPTRQQLGAYLLGAMHDEYADYVRFHIESVGCRVCQANLDDLQAQNDEQESTVEQRRRRYFQSSAGYLSRGRIPSPRNE